MPLWWQTWFSPSFLHNSTCSSLSTMVAPCIVLVPGICMHTVSWVVSLEHGVSFFVDRCKGYNYMEV
jgi:hypothetical protein